MHANALRGLDHSTLKRSILEFKFGKILDGASEYVIAGYPRPDPNSKLIGLDKWEVGFKSIRIKETAMNSMAPKEYAQLLETYDL
jgi:hypothetical protein